MDQFHGPLLDNDLPISVAFVRVALQIRLVTIHIVRFEQSLPQESHYFRVFRELKPYSL